MQRSHHPPQASWYWLLTLLVGLPATGGLTLAGCSFVGGEASRSASAPLEPKMGSGVGGTVTFYEVSGGVRVGAAVSGLSPGPYGFRIHEEGNCGGEAADSAGGIYKALGFMEANARGAAVYDSTHDALSLEDDSIIGRSVLVHAAEDDLTPPPGEAGSPVACGVIRSG